MEHENIVTAWELMQMQSSFALQQIAISAIKTLRVRNDLAILENIDEWIPISSFSYERIRRLGTKDRVKFIEGLYDDCSTFEKQDIADYTCGMASDEKLRESIDWREEMERYREEQESYSMERTLSAPQI